MSCIRIRILIQCHDIVCEDPCSSRVWTSERSPTSKQLRHAVRDEDDPKAALLGSTDSVLQAPRRRHEENLYGRSS